MRRRGQGCGGGRQLEPRGGLAAHLEAQLGVLPHHRRHGAHHLQVLRAHARVEVLDSDYGHAAGAPGREPVAMAQWWRAMAGLLAAP